MKLLIKSDWRRIFDMYLIDFKQKQTSLGDSPPPPSAINALNYQFFLFPEALAAERTFPLKNHRCNLFATRFFNRFRP